MVFPDISIKLNKAHCYRKEKKIVIHMNKDFPFIIINHIWVIKCLLFMGKMKPDFKLHHMQIINIRGISEMSGFSLSHYLTIYGKRNVLFIGKYCPALTRIMKNSIA